MLAKGGGEGRGITDSTLHKVQTIEEREIITQFQEQATTNNLNVDCGLLGCDAL
jgi:hypothetical protein